MAALSGDCWFKISSERTSQNSSKQDASTYTCKIPSLGLKVPGSCQPYGRQSVVNPWITCTVEPHRETKKKVTTPGKHVLIPPNDVMSCWKCRAPYSLGQHWKNGCCRGFQQATGNAFTLKRWVPDTAGSSSTKRRRQGETWKKASSSLYLDELPGWKM